MRVLVFCNQYLPAVHGVTSAVSNLARQAIRLGHQIVVVTSRHRSDLSLIDQIDGIDVWRFNWRLRPIISYPTRFLASFLRLISYARSWRPDLLYQHYVSPDVIYPVVLHKITKLPLVVRAGGSDILEEFHIRFDQPFLVRCAFRNSEVIGYCSQYLMNEGAELVRVAGKKACLIRDGVDVERIMNAPIYSTETPYLLNVGRFVYKKGQDHLVLAYKQVISEFPNAPELWLCGDGDERPRVEQVVKFLGLQDRIRFLGDRPQAEVASLMRGCKFYVHSARMEPLGIVLLEAMAAGKAVISPYVGGIPETVVPNVTGILTPPNPKSIAEGILSLLKEPERAEKMGRAGHDYVKACFDWPDVVQDYVQVWSSVLKK
jgi:glycosyltransferase involved in cell wall biosynthesis